MNCNRHYQMVERMSAFQISISSRKLERTPRDPLGTGINEITVKFQNEAPGLIFFRGPFWGAYVWRGLYSKGNLRFKIELASLLFGSKFTIFALFHLVFEGNFPSTSPWGLIFGGAIYRRVFCITSLEGLYLEGLIHMEGLIFRILQYFKFLTNSETCPLHREGQKMITNGRDQWLTD